MKQLRSPTRDIAPAAPDLDTIEEAEEQETARVPTPTEQLETSVSVENLEGSISYADLTVPLAAGPQPNHVDIITEKLMAEMLQEVADEAAQYRPASEADKPAEEARPETQTPKLEITLPDPSSTAELRLSDPTDLGACSPDPVLASWKCGPDRGVVLAGVVCPFCRGVNRRSVRLGGCPHTYVCWDHVLCLVQGVTRVR